MTAIGIAAASNPDDLTCVVERTRPSARASECVGNAHGSSIVDGVILVSARYEIPDVCAREWAFAALDATRPYTVLVVAAVDERDVSASTSDGYRGAFVLDNTFLRDADKAKTSGVASRTSDGDAKPPPPGAMVLGAAAATLCRCEELRIPARLVAVPVPSGARKSGRGTGFCGGVDRKAASHATQIIACFSGFPFNPVVGSGSDLGQKTEDAVIPDSSRVYT